MKIAIPVVEGQLAAHFGHCEYFALVEVDADGLAVLGTQMLQAPPHQPGLLPRWLHEQGADLIIASGMGRRAQALFADASIQVVVGAPAAPPQQIVEQYLAGRLQTGNNICDH